jgi:hypothetical protein
MEEQFAQAANEWDLERLYKDLADAKQKVAPHKRRGLTEVERVHLRFVTVVRLILLKSVM